MSISIAEKLKDDIAAVGIDIVPPMIEASYAMFAPYLEPPGDDIESVLDIAYGPHPRHQLDIYRPKKTGSGTALPVFVFIPGGGFDTGDKRLGPSPFHGNMGVFGAQNGFIGIVINYRLAPEASYPADVEDMTACVDWIIGHISEYGGDPDTIIIAGHSAGCGVLADYLTDADLPKSVKGAVLLSGIFVQLRAAMPPGAISYYEPVLPQEGLRTVVLDQLSELQLPMFIGVGEKEPQPFIDQAHLLQDLVKKKQGRDVPLAIAKGHNHITLVSHIGSAETAFSDPMLDFMRSCAG